MRAKTSFFIQASKSSQLTHFSSLLFSLYSTSFPHLLLAIYFFPWGYPGGSVVKKRRPGFNPWVRKTPGEGSGNSLQYSCLGNSMDRGVWWAIVHRVAKSWTRFRNSTTIIFFPNYIFLHSHLDGRKIQCLSKMLWDISQCPVPSVHFPLKHWVYLKQSLDPWCDFQIPCSSERLQRFYTYLW